jgi:hypothetical protein
MHPTVQKKNLLNGMEKKIIFFSMFVQMIIVKDIKGLQKSLPITQKMQFSKPEE